MPTIYHGMVSGVQVGLSASAIGNIPPHFHLVIERKDQSRKNYLRRITVVIPTPTNGNLDAKRHFSVTWALLSMSKGLLIVTGSYDQGR